MQCRVVYSGREEMDNKSSLTHWKYKYKKRVNGKWRYYYDVGPAGFDLGGNGPGKDGEPDSRIQGYTKLQDMIGKDEKDAYTRSLKRYNRLKDNQLATGANDKNIDWARRAVNEYGEQFYKTPLGKIQNAKHKIDSGRNFVSKLLSVAAEKVKAKDNYISYLEKKHG